MTLETLLTKSLIWCLQNSAGRLTPKATHKVPEDVARILKHSLGSWQFDVMDLCEATANRPLSTLAVYLFTELSLTSQFGLEGEKVERFFREIERGYPAANPYHNRAHGASVLHKMFTLLVHGGLQDSVSLALLGTKGGQRSGRLGIMACLFAAAIHDFEHEGVTNDFMIKTHHTRAAQNRHRHVNESHHVRAALAVLFQPENNFLADLPKRDLLCFVDLVTHLVLATDMADDKKIVEEFVVRLPTGSAPDASVQQKPFVPQTAEDARLLLCVAMKCADLGHLTLGWEAHTRWVRGLEEEFFQQGDLEKRVGLPISFLMDRCKPGVSASQVGFMDYVALPVFRALARAAPATEPALTGVTKNSLRWRELASPPGESR